MKDLLSNKKYFTQRNPIPQHVVYVGECLIALVLFMLDAWFWPISFAIFIIGSIIEVILTSKYISDKYFESFLPDEKKLFISEFEAIYRPVDPRLYHRNAVGSATLSEKHGTPVYGGEYRYLDSDFEKLSTEPQIRVGLDGVVRSSVYCFTAMQIDARRVCLMTKRIGMTEDRSVTDHAALPYVELSDVRLETVPVPVDNRAAHCIEMVFIDQSGRERFRLPIHGDCNDEETVERLCDLIRKSAEEEI